MVSEHAAHRVPLNIVQLVSDRDPPLHGRLCSSRPSLYPVDDNDAIQAPPPHRYAYTPTATSHKRYLIGKLLDSAVSTAAKDEVCKFVSLQRVVSAQPRW